MYTLSLKRPHFVFELQKFQFVSPGQVSGVVSIKSSIGTAEFEGSVSPSDILNIDLKSEDVKLGGWGWSFEVNRNNEDEWMCKLAYESSTDPLKANGSEKFVFEISGVVLSQEARNELVEEISFFQQWLKTA